MCRASRTQKSKGIFCLDRVKIQFFELPTMNCLTPATSRHALSDG